MTSWPMGLPSDHQVWKLTESLMNRELPSAMSTLTPPGCRLRAAFQAGTSCCTAGYS